ncbi:MAG: type II toxin-antitoxin system VapC family toxin [Hahellaceae bacterium]|nr:type II toxin-antitoxin system VapC family toxin [Hahellaceae bacterium]
MGFMKALFDTNILIDYLNGVEKAREELLRYEQRFISPITWMEVMVGVQKENETVVRKFLATFEQVVINQDVAERAVGIRRNNRIRLPDAIIWASAHVKNALLVTRNVKDFPPGEPGVRIPYTV